MPLNLEMHIFFPFFTHSYTNLGSSLFLWWKFFLTEIYPGIPESGAVACALEGSFTLFQASWIAVWSSGAGLRAMSHSGVLAAPQASTSPKMSDLPADKELISLLHSLCRHSSSPGRGRNAELGLELCLPRLEWSLQRERGSAACLPGTPPHLHPAFCSLGWNQPLFTGWSKGALHQFTSLLFDPMRRQLAAPLGSGAFPDRHCKLEI